MLKILAEVAGCDLVDQCLLLFLVSSLVIFMELVAKLDLFELMMILVSLLELLVHLGFVRIQGLAAKASESIQEIQVVVVLGAWHEAVDGLFSFFVCLCQEVCLVGTALLVVLLLGSTHLICFVCFLKDI